MEEINEMARLEFLDSNFIGDQKNSFINRLKVSDVNFLYFLRKDNPEFIPLLFDFDILSFILKVLYY